MMITRDERVGASPLVWGRHADAHAHSEVKECHEHHQVPGFAAAGATASTAAIHPRSINSRKNRTLFTRDTCVRGGDEVSTHLQSVPPQAPKTNTRKKKKGPEQLAVPQISRHGGQQVCLTRGALLCSDLSLVTSLKTSSKRLRPPPNSLGRPFYSTVPSRSLLWSVKQGGAGVWLKKTWNTKQNKRQKKKKKLT